MGVVLQDPTSLDSMHDIVVADPTSWWPPAPGWYVLGALVAIALVCGIVSAVAFWWKNRYRAAALRELDQLRQLSQDSQRRWQAVSGLDQLLKRVALVAWPRQHVASLSGAEWIDFLNRTATSKSSAGTTLLSSNETQTLLDVAYSRQVCERLSVADIDGLFDKAARWIKEHSHATPGDGLSKSEGQP